jgi:uncharacterized protein (TIGR03437 family)
MTHPKFWRILAATSVLTFASAQSTAPEDQTASGEFQAEFAHSDGSIATFYLQLALSQDAAGNNRAAAVGVFGYVRGNRNINITGVDVRAGEAVYRPGMAPSNPVRGAGAFSGGGATGPVGTAVMTALTNDPSSVEVVIRSEDQPDGLYRGRLKRSQLTYAAAFPQGNGATGWDVILVSTTRNAQGRIDSAMLQHQIASIKGLNLRPANGVYPWRTAIMQGNAPLIDFGSPSDEAATAPGYPGSIMYSLDTRDEDRRAMVERFVSNPSAFQLRVMPNGLPDNVLAGALRKMDRAVFHPRLGGPADTDAYVEADFTRDENGVPDSGIIFNISDWSTPALRGTVRTIRLHAGGSGETGPALADLVTAETGAPVARFLIGALVAHPDDGRAIGAVDRLISYPDLTYLHAVTADNAEGFRGQALPFPGLPVIESIVPATFVPGGFAPGSLITIRGQRLAKVASGLEALPAGTLRLPEGLNGAIVQTGSRRAPLLYVSPTQINAQIPFEATGELAVAVNHGTGPSESRVIRLAPRAPSLFPQLESADGVITVYGTGFGQTNPELPSGRLVPPGEYRIPGVSATLGGQPAEVLEASALPGLPGLYRVRVRTAGRSGMLVVRVDGVESNAVSVR